MSRFKSGGIGKGKYKKGDRVLIVDENEQLATILDMEKPHNKEWRFYKLITPCGRIEYSHEQFLESFKD